MHNPIIWILHYNTGACQFVHISATIRMPSIDIYGLRRKQYIQDAFGWLCKTVVCFAKALAKPQNCKKHWFDVRIACFSTELLIQVASNRLNNRHLPGACPIFPLPHNLDRIPNVTKIYSLISSLISNWSKRNFNQRCLSVSKLSFASGANQTNFNYCNNNFYRI